MKKSIIILIILNLYTTVYGNNNLRILEIGNTYEFNSISELTDVEIEEDCLLTFTVSNKSLVEIQDINNGLFVGGSGWDDKEFQINLMKGKYDFCFIQYEYDPDFHVKIKVEMIISDLGTLERNETYRIMNPLSDIKFSVNIDMYIDITINIELAILCNENGTEIAWPENNCISLGISPGKYYLKIRNTFNDGCFLRIETIGIAANLTESKNFIHKQIFTEEGEKQYLEEIQYYDGFGRPTEMIQRNITPSFSDLISIQEYDDFGRATSTWLPIAMPSKNGAFADPVELKNAIKASSIYGNDQNPFSQPVYEASPLNRVLKQFGPGQDWQNNERAVNTDYLTNIAADDILNCIYYSISESSNKDILLTLIKEKNYDTGELYVTKISDENENLSYEFKDKLGQVVLTRQIENDSKLDTYYVYDDFGNLRIVLPPIASQNLKNKSSWNSQTNEYLKQYAYLYKYDNRNRCIAKKLPGSDWIYSVYDKADQLIFTQDGEQRAKGEWLFSIPDAFGRPVLSGVCNDTLNVHNSVVRADYTGSGVYKGYTLSISGLNQYSLLTVNYYDNYDFLNKNSFPNFEYDQTKESKGFGKQYNEGKGYEAKTLLTGTITSTFGTESNTELYSVMYYDNRGRLIQTHTSNHLSGVDKSYTAYNFTGQPVKMLSTQSVILKDGQAKETSELYSYTYDHAGRLLETRHTIGNSNHSMIIRNEYDELGRLASSDRNVYKANVNP